MISFPRLLVLLCFSVTSMQLSVGAEKYLQYDAVMVNDETREGSGAYVLFLRYHVTEDRVAGEVLHYEPGWNVSDFAWRVRGLTIDSTMSQLSVQDTFRDTQMVVEKPLAERPPPRFGAPRVLDLAYSEAQMLHRINQIGGAIQGRPGTADAVQIDRDLHGRVIGMVLLAEDSGAIQTKTRYEYGPDGTLASIRVDSQPVLVSVPGTYERVDESGAVQHAIPLAVYHDGGRMTQIHFDNVELDGISMRMPVHVEIRRLDNGAFVRSLLHHDFKIRTLHEGMPPPWDTWEGARLSKAEADRIWLLVKEGYWLGQRQPTVAHAAFYSLFLKPLNDIEEQYDTTAMRLRNFFHAYHAAMVLGDEEYLAAGFPWYLEQIASLESPALLLRAGQECIRLLIRWGYLEIADGAFLDWGRSVHAHGGRDWEAAIHEYLERGLIYYAFRLFDSADDVRLSPRDAYGMRYRRSMALRRLGAQPQRDQLADLGRADPSWASLTLAQWQGMVAEEFAKATELFLAIENPSREEQRMQDSLESFYLASQEGRGFVASTATP